MERRRRRTAPRIAGLLACAAVPAMLLAGCSSGSGSGSGMGSGSGSGSGKNSTAGADRSTDGKTTASPGAGATSAAPTVAPARFAQLPDPCRTLSKDTVAALVPKVKTAAGTKAESSDITARGGCSWTGNGKDGYQYRWLSVALQRFDSSTAVGSAEDQAKRRYEDEVAQVGQAAGVTASPATGLGDQASSASGRATVSKVTSQNDTVVVRTGNVVAIVEFNGAGLEGKKNPSAQTVNSGAQRAAKDVVAAVAAANA